MREPPAMQPFDVYLALGDSMSIDKYAGGPGLGAASLLFHNNDAMYPDFRGRDVTTANPSARFRLLAEDGHASTDLEKVIDELERSPAAARQRRTLLTVTIGGNDMLFWWASGGRTVQDGMRHLNDFAVRMNRILSRLGALFPEHVLLLGNVYDPTDGTGKLQSGRDVSPGLPIIGGVNQALAAVARQNGARYVDIHRHFVGHGMRHKDKAFEHYHPDDPSGWVMFDIEPNPRGSSEIRRLFLEALS